MTQPTQTPQRIITAVTGTRADYGLFRTVLRAIGAHPRLRLQVLITGMHLIKKFGYTAAEVGADGWPICGKVPLQSDKDNADSQSVALGRAISGMSRIFSATNTDIVLVLGDRLESFAAAAAAAAGQRIIAHIHGGDVAPGIQDDAYRHAITKLAHIHFAASKGAARRLSRLGEDQSHIYQTGSPAIDDIFANAVCDPATLNSWAGFDTGSDFIIVMQHPAGGTAPQEYQRMKQTLRACRRSGLPLLVIYPNCDCGFSGIIQAIEEFRRYPDIHIARHIPRPIFVSLLQRCRVLAGNSSCGIVEAGALNTSVINIGPRQMNRERGNNVVDCDYGTESIDHLLNNFLKFNRFSRKPCRIYGHGGSGQQIASILARIHIGRKLRLKLITY